MSAELIEFFQKCSDAGCAVIPVPLYHKYNDTGDPLHPDNYLGLFYAAVPFTDHAVDTERYFMIEEHFAGSEALKGTPEEALRWFQYNVDLEP